MWVTTFSYNILYCVHNIFINKPLNFTPYTDNQLIIHQSKTSHVNGGVQLDASYTYVALLNSYLDRLDCTYQQIIKYEKWKSCIYGFDLVQCFVFL